MRYFLRKYKEKLNQSQLKPIQLCFDSDDNDTDTTKQHDLESIPELLNDVSSGGVGDSSFDKTITTTTHHKTIKHHHQKTPQTTIQTSSSSSIHHTTSSSADNVSTILTRSKLKQLKTTTTANSCCKNVVDLSPLIINKQTTLCYIKQQRKNNRLQQQLLLHKQSPLVPKPQLPTPATTTTTTTTDTESCCSSSCSQSDDEKMNIDEPTTSTKSATKTKTTTKYLLLSTTSSTSSSSSSSSSSTTSSSLTILQQQEQQQQDQEQNDGYITSDSSDEDKQTTNKKTKENCPPTLGGGGGGGGNTPPHKKFRKLRLFDTPQTPKTLIKKSKFIFNNNPTTTTATTTTTQQPAYHKTPSSVLQNSPKTINDDHGSAKQPLRVRLFDHNGNDWTQRELNDMTADNSFKIRTPPITHLSPYQPQANINPFTPNNQTNQELNSINNNTTLFNHNNSASIGSCTTTTTTSSSSYLQITNSNDFQLTVSNSIKRAHRSTLSSNSNGCGGGGGGGGDSVGGDLIDHDYNQDDDLVPKNKRLALRQCLVSRYHEEFHEVCKLGSGEFGDVFKCINRLDGCTYAIKRSKKPIAGSALEISAWKEVCAHAVLVKHNHIVQYYSAWAEADRMLIQNEYCNGGSLVEYIEANRLSGECMSECDLKLLLLHTAKGLAYMHSLNLVHMDIKPGNIFICRTPRIQTRVNEESGIESETESEQQQLQQQNGGISIQSNEIITYKIGDLGHVTSTLEPCVEEGDCRYLPNEILQEQYTHLSKADVFALALTVYECGSNDELPKNGDEWHWIREGNLRPMTNCSEKFQKLLIQMINKDPILRPSANTLVHHPCICPDASKNKAQLLKELNQEKFKNELLKRKVREYEQQIKDVASPIKQHQQQQANKFARSLSLNILK